MKTELRFIIVILLATIAYVLIFNMNGSQKEVRTVTVGRFQDGALLSESIYYVNIKNQYVIEEIPVLKQYNSNPMKKYKDCSIVSWENWNCSNEDTLNTDFGMIDGKFFNRNPVFAGLTYKIIK